MSEREEEDVQDALARLELAIRTQVEKSMSVKDMRVSTQHSRLYKFYCWIVYGHLLNEKNVCLRCGKIIKNGSNGNKKTS